MLSENDCSTDHPVIGPSGDKEDLKAKKEQLKKGCSTNHPVIGPPGNCSGSSNRGFQGGNEMCMEDKLPHICIWDAIEMNAISLNWQSNKFVIHSKGENRFFEQVCPSWWTVCYNKTLKPMVDSGCGNCCHLKVRPSRYTLAQLSVLLLAGSLMYLELYNMEGSVYRAFCNQNI